VTVRSERRPGLGRGLAALIPQETSSATSSVEIPLARIRRNPYQPRMHIDDADLSSLAASIAEHGVIQPILVTETLDGYQLVAGERRVRAAELAGLVRIPAVIRQLADREQLELALVENLQRTDLDPIEAARAYRQLIDEFGFSQEALSERIGRARSTVANTLRLLDLEAPIQEAVGTGTISEGHARALGGLAAAGQARVLSIVVERGLSVRETEELVRRLRGPRTNGRLDAGGAPSRVPGVATDGGEGDSSAASAANATATTADPEIERMEEELRRALGTKVSVGRTRRGGRIVIEYYSDEELARLFELLVGASA
jgi:ParB family transcriptional regulator, chromosome partitioning protein